MTGLTVGKTFPSNMSNLTDFLIGMGISIVVVALFICWLNCHGVIVSPPKVNSKSVSNVNQLLTNPITKMPNGDDNC